MDNTYNDREIDGKFDALKTLLEEIRDDHLVGIKEQVMKTNGRVSSLENWRYLLVGGMSIITMMVIPLVIYIYNTNITIEDKLEVGIDAGIESALEKFLINQ